MSTKFVAEASLAAVFVAKASLAAAACVSLTAACASLASDASTTISEERVGSVSARAKHADETRASSEVCSACAESLTLGDDEASACRAIK